MMGSESTTAPTPLTGCHLGSFSGTILFCLALSHGQCGCASDPGHIRSISSPAVQPPTPCLYKCPIPSLSSKLLPTVLPSPTTMAAASVLTTALLILMLAATEAKTTAVAPGPTPGPLNLTGILDKGSQYTTLIRLLSETQVGGQIQSQLNSSFDGLTLFAPTDNAFNNLKPGTLNSLTAQDQVALVLYHVLPRFYSLATFETTSNPVRTQASGNNGVYSVNITSTSNQVNVSTGIDVTQVSNVLYSEFPLAVYSIDKVLLPYDIFGPKPPAAAPLPGVVAPKKPGKVPAAAKGPAAAAQADSTSPSAASHVERGLGWVLVVGLMCIGSLL